MVRSSALLLAVVLALASAAPIASVEKRTNRYPWIVYPGDECAESDGYGSTYPGQRSGSGHNDKVKRTNTYPWVVYPGDEDAKGCKRTKAQGSNHQGHENQPKHHMVELDLVYPRADDAAKLAEVESAA